MSAYIDFGAGQKEIMDRHIALVKELQSGCCKGKERSENYRFAKERLRRNLFLNAVALLKNNTIQVKIGDGLSRPMHVTEVEQHRTSGFVLRYRRELAVTGVWTISYKTKVQVLVPHAAAA